MPRHRQPGRPRVRLPTRYLVALVGVALTAVAWRGFLAQLDRAEQVITQAQAAAASGEPTPSDAVPVQAPDASSTAAGSPVASVVSSAASTPPASITSTRSGVRCTAPGGGASAAQVVRLQRAVAKAVGGSADRVSLAVRDWRTGIACSYRADEAYATASIIKVATLAAVMHEADETDGALTAAQQALAKRSITVSDNAAQASLWQAAGGRGGMQEYFEEVGMDDTTADPQWGLTRTTAADQVRLLTELTHGELLSAEHRDDLLGLMREVDADQDWGVTAGAPSGTSVAVKNGWYPAGSWRAHSIGYVSGSGRDRVMAVLSDGNATLESGIATVERTARAVHTALG